MWVLYDQQVQHLLDNFTPPPHFTPRVPESEKIHANISTLLKQYPTHGRGFCQETHTARVKHITGACVCACVRAHTHQHARAAASLSSSFSLTQSIFFPPRWKDYSDNKANKSAILQGSAQGQRRMCEDDFKRHFTERAASSCRRQWLKSHRQIKRWQASPF